MTGEGKCSSLTSLVPALPEDPFRKIKIPTRKRYHSESEVEEIKKILERVDANQWQRQTTRYREQEIGPVNSAEFVAAEISDLAPETASSICLIHGLNTQLQETNSDQSRAEFVTSHLEEPQPVLIPDAELALPGGKQSGHVTVYVELRTFIMNVRLQRGSTVSALRANEIVRDVIKRMGTGDEMIQDFFRAELPLHMRLTVDCRVRLVSPAPAPPPSPLPPPPPPSQL